MKSLTFEVKEDDGSLLLWVSDNIAIIFNDLVEWKKFANDMLHMTDEISENLGISNE